MEEIEDGMQPDETVETTEEQTEEHPPSPDEDRAAHDRAFAELRRAREAAEAQVAALQQEKQAFLDEVRNNPVAYRALLNQEPEIPDDAIPPDVRDNPLGEQLFRRLAAAEARLEQLQGRTQQQGSQAAMAAWLGDAERAAMSAGVNPQSNPRKFKAFVRQAQGVFMEKGQLIRTPADRVAAFQEAIEEMGWKTNGRSGANPPPSTTAKGAPTKAPKMPKTDAERKSAIADALREAGMR